MTHNEPLGVILLLVTMFLWGLTPILEKLGLREVEPLTGVLIRSLAITVVLVGIFIATGRIGELVRVPVRSIVLFSTSGILAGLLGMWTYLYVLKTGVTTKIVPIAAAYPLVTAILSILILREGVTLQRMIGIVLTIAGIALINKS
jgi:bacterial/archaeal transporter family protein